MNESSSSPAALTEQVRHTLSYGGSRKEALAALDALAEALARAEKERDELRDAVAEGRMNKMREALLYVGSAHESVKRDALAEIKVWESQLEIMAGRLAEWEGDE